MAIRLITSSNPLFRLVICSQWCLLALTIVLQTLSLAFIQQADPLPVALSLVMLALLSVTSIYLPENRPYWFKVLFIFFELIVISTTLLLGVPRWVWPLYLVLVARASLLLRRREVWLIVALGCVSQVGICLLKLSVTGELQAPANLIASMVLTSSYAALMIVVAWWMQALISEQMLKQRAASLASENQALAAELERNRIARELHDSLGHSLTALKIQLELAGKMFDRDLELSRKAVGQAQQLAAKSLAETRDTLRRIAHDNFDFEVAVAELIKDVEANGCIRIQAKIAKTDGISNSVVYQLYRIMQECMTNALKHGGAAEIEVELIRDRSSLSLLVHDDGCGFDPSLMSPGFGIKGMKERASALGAEINFISQPKNGTTVQVAVPLL